jgi:hypothetical protein
LAQNDDQPEVSPLGVSVQEALKTADIGSVASGLAEVAVDATLSQGVLRDVPVVGTLVGLWRAGKTVRDFVFVKKLAGFLNELSAIPLPERASMIDRLEEDPAFAGKVGEQIVLLLDRLDSVGKAVLTGRAFRAYCLGRIDIMTLQRAVQVIDRLLEHDLRQLPRFIRDERVENLTIQAFLNVGLAYMPINHSSTTIRPNSELCMAIVAHVLGEV